MTRTIIVEKIKMIVFFTLDELVSEDVRRRRRRRRRPSMSQEHPSRVAATRSYDLRFLLSDKGASGTTQTRLRQTSGRRTSSSW